MTVIRGVKGIKQECQLIERCDGHDHGGGGGVWEGDTVVRRCDSSQGGVKVVRNLFQLMERYDGCGEDVRGCGKV